MPKIRIKQQDITDCGATCLASVSAHYNLQLPIARIRQYASTDKKGTNVETWLKYPSIQDNIKFLREGMSSKGMLDPNNNLKMFIENAEIHIYMKKSNVSPSLKAVWLNKLSADYPDIKFEIKVVEDFIN